MYKSYSALWLTLVLSLCLVYKCYPQRDLLLQTLIDGNDLPAILKDINHIEIYRVETQKHQDILVHQRKEMAVVFVYNKTEDVDFMVVEYHTSKGGIHISQSRLKIKNKFDFPSDDAPALIMRLGPERKEGNLTYALLFVWNELEPQTVLFVAKNYSLNDPMPGTHPQYGTPRPYLDIKVDLMLTSIKVPAADYLMYDTEEEFCFVNNNLCKNSSDPKDELDFISRYLKDSKYFLMPTYELYVMSFPHKCRVAKFYTHLEVIKKASGSFPHSAVKLYETQLDSTQKSFEVNMVSHGGHDQAVIVKVSYDNSSQSLYALRFISGCPTSNDSCQTFTATWSPAVSIALVVVGIPVACISSYMPKLSVVGGFFLFCWYFTSVIAATFTSYPYLNIIPIITLSLSILITIGAILIFWFCWEKGCYRKYYKWVEILFMIPMRILGFGLSGMILSYYYKVYSSAVAANFGAIFWIPILFSFPFFLGSFKVPLMDAYYSILVGTYSALLGFSSIWPSTFSYIIIEPIASMIVRDYVNAVGMIQFMEYDEMTVFIFVFLVVLIFFAQIAYIYWMHIRVCPQCSFGSGILSHILMFIYYTDAIQHHREFGVTPGRGVSRQIIDRTARNEAYPLRHLGSYSRGQTNNPDIKSRQQYDLLNRQTGDDTGRGFENDDVEADMGQESRMPMASGEASNLGRLGEERNILPSSSIRSRSNLRYSSGTYPFTYQNEGGAITTTDTRSLPCVLGSPSQSLYGQLTQDEPDGNPVDVREVPEVLAAAKVSNAPNVPDVPNVAVVPKVEVPKVEVPKVEVPKVEVPKNSEDIFPGFHEGGPLPSFQELKQSIKK